ncbi:imidazole glycerol phosphate synthase subunit HisF [Paenibacillus sp. YYML68]|uniref:imidazole glycerol phosphate synthase subunit HisF n=1 Tax=Paenibacillus sp. YYML68 TaxID=2909250 RepID=UPI002492AA77|nr:imidazole glycerol phosphate synthase cyclase subunit [Paenibacillus sp. YYML68]
MLKYRVIPTLLWKNVGLVKGVAFDSWRRVGTVLPAIKVYNTREVDELILLDITATAEDREPDYESVAEFSQECFVPLTVGGGIKHMDQITKLLRCGADKVAINSAAFSDPELIRAAAHRFGSQCIVASIDVKKRADGTYECYSGSGTLPMGVETIKWAQQLEKWGAGEILVTSIERDGTMEGYDLELVRLIADSVNIPVIASGGAGKYDDFLMAIQGGASAVAAASMFHFTEQTPKEAKEYLSQHQVPVRNYNVSKL